MKRIALLIFCLFMCHSIDAQIYLNEIMVSPPGDDSPREFIELRGTPGATIPVGTYLVQIEGDEESGEPGDVESNSLSSETNTPQGGIIDLGGLELGSNGFLVILTGGHPYAGILHPDATVITGVTDGTLEDKSHTFLLINAPVEPSTNDDIDSDNDGIPDGAVYNSWTILDGISFLDDDYGVGEFEYAYSDVVFVDQATLDSGSVKAPPTATIIGTPIEFDYFARVGNSTGSTLTNDVTSDWMGADLSTTDLSVDNWETSSTPENNFPEVYAGYEVNHLGSPNPIPASLVIPGDDACNAITINVNDTSTGDQFTNDGATVQIGEPNANFNAGINNSVWFEFTAPTNGDVKITTDIAGGSLTNTEMAIYEVGDCSDFSTYQQLNFDQDTGTNVSNNSVINIYGLTSGLTYYIQVDGFDIGSRGTFGLEVKDLLLDQLYINEIMVSPPGADSPNEFIELRGTPGATIPAGTYLVQIEGDEESGEPGDVETNSISGTTGTPQGGIIDLGGLQLGSNGFLVILTDSHPYAGILHPDATVITGVTDGTLEDKSHTFLLINAPAEPSTNDDIDSDNDGVPDGAVYNSWTILDGISMLDDDYVAGEFEYAYSDVVFVDQATLDSGSVKAPPTATIIGTPNEFDYFARVGNSTGSSLTSDLTSDWMGGDLSTTDLSVDNWETSSTPENNFPEVYAGYVVDHLGSENPIPNALMVAGDNVCNAISININETSTGDQYTNNGATVQTNEPMTNFHNQVNQSVWFKFQAPAYGNVQINTDISGGSLINTEIAVYKVISCNDFSTFTQIGFDQDSGENVNKNSILNLYDLEAGETYYIQVDGYFETDLGTFGIKIQDLTYTYDSTNLYQPSDPSGQDLRNHVLYILSGTAPLASATTFRSIEIEPEAVLDIGADLTADILFKSNENGSAQLANTDNANITGVATVERYIPQSNRAYRYIGSPVNTTYSINKNLQEGATSASFNPNPKPGYGTHITGGSTSDGFDANETGNASMFYWDTCNGSDCWMAISNTNVKTMNVGEAYALLFRGDRSTNLNSNTAIGPATTLRFSGTIESGDFSIPSEDLASDGFFSLIPNPYQAIVDLKTLLESSDASGLDSNTIYIYDPTLGTKGGYATVDWEGGTVTTTPEIPGSSNANENLMPNQAFFIQSTSDTPALTFRETYKSTSADFVETFSDQNNLSYININLKRQPNSILTDGLRLSFDDAHTNAFNASDAIKFWNYDERIAVFNSNNYLSIEKRQNPQTGEEIQLYLDNFMTDHYTLNIKLQNINHEVVLYDNYLDIETPLNAHSINTIEFSVDQSVPESSDNFRFSLKVKETLSINNFDINTLKIYPNPVVSRHFQVEGLDASEDTWIEIFDTTGRLVYKTFLEDYQQGVISIESALDSGIYIMRLTRDSVKYQSKLIFKN